MSAVSTIPSPVAAEMLGPGSFFGSCQIAAGGFESYLQSASEVGFGTQVQAVSETQAEGEALIPFDVFIELMNMNSLDGYKAFKESPVLSRLKEELGEEEGEEAFKTIKNFLEKYKDKFIIEMGGEDPKFSEEIMILFRLIKALDPKYASETPVEEQQAGLEGILKEILEKIIEEIRKLLANEMAQPETEMLLPEAEILQATQQPNTEIPQPAIELPQPAVDILQSATELPQPAVEIPQPTTEIPQIATEILQQAVEIPQPTTEKPKPEEEVAQQETEEKKSPLKLYDWVFLARQMGIEPSEGFFKFMDDLLKQGYLDDFEEVTMNFGVSEVIEKKELNFFEETLKELWECIKNGDEPKKEELLSLLKEIAVGRELSKQFKENLGTEQNTEVLDKVPDKTSDKALDSVLDLFSKKESESKEDELNPANLVKPAKHSEAKHEKPIQPEVRATWEGATLKIELVNPKTGEKLQTVETAMPHRMQERINEFEVIKQIAAQARFITTPTGEQKLTIQLNPEHLGHVDLRITLNNGEMQIHARVESSTAQNALESHIGLLRDGLEKQGINLERLEVSVEQRDRNAYALAQEHENQQHGEKNKKHKRGRTSHLAVSVARDENADTGRRLGYNTMEYLA